MQVLKCKCGEEILFDEQWNGLSYVSKPFIEDENAGKLYINYCSRCGEYLVPHQMKRIKAIEEQEKESDNGV